MNKKNIILFSLLLLENHANCMNKNEFEFLASKFSGDISNINSTIRDANFSIEFRPTHIPQSNLIKIIYNVACNKKAALHFINKQIVGLFDLTFAPMGTTNQMAKDLQDILSIAGDRIKCLSLPYGSLDKYFTKENCKKLKNLKYLDIHKIEVTVKSLKHILDRIPTLASLTCYDCFTSSEPLSDHDLPDKFEKLRQKYVALKIETTYHKGGGLGISSFDSDDSVATECGRSDDEDETFYGTPILPDK